MRIENPLSALYRGTEYFSLVRTFRTVWGGALELAYRRCSGMILDNSTYYCGPLELALLALQSQKSERYSSMSKRYAPSEREVPSERDADAADYEAGHSDAEFNEAAYPLAAGLDADCSCLK